MYHSSNLFQIQMGSRVGCFLKRRVLKSLARAKYLVGVLKTIWIGETFPSIFYCHPNCQVFEPWCKCTFFRKEHHPGKTRPRVCRFYAAGISSTTTQRTTKNLSFVTLLCAHVIVFWMCEFGVCEWIIWHFWEAVPSVIKDCQGLVKSFCELEKYELE